jgi:hypothetical protein
MAAPRWLRRAALFAPAAGCVLLAIVLAGAASSTTTLACDRAAGRCTWSTRAWHGGSSRAFAITDVREVRFVEGLGKHGRRAETALVFASGHELHLATDDEGAARDRFHAIDAFFAGRGPALREHQAGAGWLYAAAIAALIAAVILAARAARRRLVDTVAPAGAPRRSIRSLLAHREVRFFLAVLAVAAVVQIGMMVVAATTQGTLELECRTRCRFQGGECLPGGGLSTTLDPGEHTIEVWAATGDAHWQPRSFSIAVGEVTHFVCE